MWTQSESTEKEAVMTVTTAQKDHSHCRGSQFVLNLFAPLALGRMGMPSVSSNPQRDNTERRQIKSSQKQTAEDPSNN